MPELPEVETVRQGLMAHIIGAKISKVKAGTRKLRYDLPQDFALTLKEASIIGLERRAKILLFHLDNDITLLSHLGMSGSWQLKELTDVQYQREHLADFSQEAKHDHLAFLLNVTIKNSPQRRQAFYKLTYNDPRRFGYLLAIESPALAAYFAKKQIGVEPLTKELTRQYLLAKLKSYKSSLKAFLLDQTIIAGLGNIYSCEVLWQAGLSPFLAGKELAAQEQAGIKIDRLIAAISDILRQAIAAGGSTLRDHRSVSGQAGSFQQNFKVYNRADKPCLRCLNTLYKCKQNGRTTYYCAHCQT